MTQEEKSILLKDLCARLPYEVEVFYNTTIPFATLITINAKKADCIVYDHSEWDRHTKFQIEEIKPYLRPMSSMTREEEAYWDYHRHLVGDGIFAIGYDNPTCCIFECFEWLNSHHFDYGGLIMKGLALEAPKDMYKF